MKKTITVTIYSKDSFDYSPENLTEYIAWLRAKLYEVPEEFRASARTDISAEEDYWCPSLCYTIKYDRPETDEEEEARERSELDRLEALRQRELATLAALRAKHEKP